MAIRVRLISMDITGLTKLPKKWEIWIIGDHYPFFNVVDWQSLVTTFQGIKIHNKPLTFQFFSSFQDILLDDNNLQFKTALMLCFIKKEEHNEWNQWIKKVRELQNFLTRFILVFETKTMFWEITDILKYEISLQTVSSDRCNLDLATLLSSEVKHYYSL
ncbi:MAG: hypothetical protein F6K03_08685, partial [Kamptonema sp. SIO4C4]|nr:hypothetical protein [Kamptonema sp. SIO4C4]